MAEVVLSEKLLANLAGWEVIKQARAIVAENRVLSSNWSPPTLRGVVQAGTTSYRAGLVIRRENDAENLCTCRQSREWGTLCAHSVSVGLHALRPPEAAPPAPRPAPGASASAAPPAPPRAPVPRGDVRRIRRGPPGSGGEPLEIHVILPPQLAEAAARGRATVFFEGRWKRGQAPLASLPLDVEFEIDAADLRLLERVELLANGDTPALLQLAPADLGSVLEALEGHPRVTFGKQQRATISRQPWKVPLKAQLEASGEIVLSVRPLPQPPALVPGQPSWVIAPPHIQPLGLPAAVLPVLGKPMRFHRPQVPTLLGPLWTTLSEASELQANFSPTDFQLTTRPPKFHLHLSGGLASLTARLQCSYGPRVLTLGLASPGEEIWMPDPAHPKHYATRDLQAERAALDRLLRHGFTGPNAQGQYQLQGQNPVLTFFAREYSRMEKEWEVTLEERLERSTQQNLERVEPQFAITPSGEQWFDLEVAYRTRSGDRFPATEIQRLLRGGQSHARLPNGKHVLLDTGAVEELEEILVDCAPEQQRQGVYRVSNAQAGFVNASLEQQQWQAAAPPEWRQQAREQSGEVELACPPLGTLESVLRPYQKHGVAWMAFLRRHRFGGILADEMGLGKTLQTLAHLQAVKTATPAAERSPHLVICPTSLVSNWVAEAERFTPGLRTLALHGPQRLARLAEIPTADLVITTYALVRRDLERYRQITFDTVVLDEAQHIKNRQTQNAHAVKAVRSRHRLVLTGTPLENSVLDLWSIFDFLMPGYLGSAADFRDRYEIPIVKERSAAVQQRLSRRVRPFLLRRLKREVAPELPARIDQVVWCDLGEEQAALYGQLLDATRREVTAAVGTQGLARSRMVVLTALLRLRQACCDLRLLGSLATGTKEEAAAPPASGKLNAFLELLEEVLDGGHRVLVFSQFTTMLGLLRERLTEQEIPYCYLDGSTVDRGGEVARFQQRPEIPVFLISLKAGGVGLNLASADTVVHFDPWWNPAVEDQATDRAHRIGQTRIVTSYKLIARGTVEEKILRLQERKREVLRGVLEGEETLSESLTWEEIQGLLE